MKSAWILGWVLNPTPGVLIRRAQRDAGARSCEGRGRDWSDAATARECQETPGAGGGTGGFSRTFRGTVALLTPVVAFWPQGL